MVIDGNQLSDEEAQSIFRTIKGNSYTVFLFSKAIGQGTMVVDASKKPKAIDARPDKGEPRLGIYKLEGQRWTICFAAPGKKRPTEFAAKAGSGQNLTVWEREQK